MKKANGLAVFLLLVGAVLTFAQDSNSDATIPPLRSTIVIGESVQKTPIRANAIFGPLSCNADGAIYARLPNQSTNVLEWPLTLITRTSSVPFEFVSRVPAVEGIPPLAFAAAVDDAGRAYYVARPGAVATTQFLLRYAADGSFLSKVVIDPNLSVFTLLPLPDDRALLVGLSKPPESEPEKRSRSAFVGIFDRDGKMIRDLTSPEDNASVATFGVPPTPFNTAMQRGGARLGQDGNIYLLKGSSPPRMHVLSSSGETQHVFKLWIPFEGAVPTDLLTSPRGFIVKYHDPDVTKKRRELLWVAYSTFDGSPRVVYDAKDLKGQVACHDGESFVVLAVTPDRYFALAKAEIK